MKVTEMDGVVTVEVDGARVSIPKKLLESQPRINCVTKDVSCDNCPERGVCDNLENRTN